MCSLFNSRTIQTSSRKGEMRAWTVQAKIEAGSIESQSSKQIRVRAGGRESQSSKQIRVRAGGRESRNEKQSRSQQNKHSRINAQKWSPWQSKTLQGWMCVVCLYGEGVMISRCVCIQSQVCRLMLRVPSDGAEEAVREPHLWKLERICHFMVVYRFWKGNK